MTPGKSRGRLWRSAAMAAQAQVLFRLTKARAMLHGQFYVSCDDVAAVAPPIFRHRIIPNFSAQSEGVTSDDITRKILEAVPKDEKLK